MIAAANDSHCCTCPVGVAGRRQTASHAVRWRVDATPGPPRSEAGDCECPGVLLDFCSSQVRHSLFRLWSSHHPKFCREFKGKFQRTVSAVRFPSAPPPRLIFLVSSVFCGRNRGFRRQMGTSYGHSEPRECPLALPTQAIGHFSPIATRVVRFQISMLLHR